jgi:NAD(P)-dependent dehydrogenase (short-subunit alcohol dehydrogenase family)
MNLRFDGKVAIVTGAARGVGREIVREFLTSGARVLATDRDEAGLAETVDMYASEGELHSVVGDISDPAGAAAIVAAAVDRFGGLHICINNAAVAPHASILDETPEVWDTVYAVNARGTFLMTQAAARVLIEAGAGGRIINFTSGVTKRGSAGAAAYSSSRAAVEVFTRVAAIEFAPYNILVNAISPGLIDTQPKPLPPRMAAGLEKRIPTLPLARAGEPEEVARVALFLASEAASYVSGAIWEVDGAASIGTRAGGQIIDDDPRYFWVKGREG